MTARWWTGRGLAFDLETTSPEPTEAHVVTANCVEVGAAGIVSSVDWLVHPTVEIPAEATAIHGISTHYAWAHGIEPSVAVPQIVQTLERAWAAGLPVIVMNASYDLTLMLVECIRLGLPQFVIGPVLDPFVIDRGCDPRRPGKRNLAALAAHYRVKQDGAHSSAGDALCAARIVWAQARRYNRWMSLDEMQHWQAKAHFDRQTDYEAYSVRQGRQERVDKEWPVRRQPGAA